MIAAITGANGFIGRHLVDRFNAAGWQVRPVFRSHYESKNLARLFSEADVVVHAAGATRAPTHDQLHASNVGLTATTLDASSQGRVGRFVYVSSQAAAGPAAFRGAAVSEDNPAAPVEAYGRTKLQAEELVRSAAGLPSVIVRPGAVYGPYDRDFLPLHRLAARGVAIHAGNRKQWISIIHVTDLVDGIFLAATATRAIGRTFFLANAEPVQWDVLFRNVASCAGRTLGVDVEIPAPIVDLGSALGDVVARLTGHAGLLTTEKVALSKSPFWICSSARARAELGFTTPTNLHHGLCATYHWYVENGWL